jgi:methylmalonyl-CoA mutase C-terminal domain/subunit
MPSESQKIIRVLVAKPGLDGHDRGAKVVARGLRDAGFEVIYTGLHQTPEMVVAAAMQEDVDIIGLSILSGAHVPLVAAVMELLKKRQLHKPVFVGGIIPPDDAQQLLGSGVAAVFGPGSAISEIVSRVHEILSN